MSAFIDTDRVSDRLRLSMVDVPRRRISLTRFGDSAQLDDLSKPPNCGGFGRSHKFVQDAFPDWPTNPLPIVPAQNALGLSASPTISAQVFQSSGCNWRCWYCFVPFADLTTKNGTFVSVAQMVEWTAEANSGPHMVDLSGGQPDLTPEWAVWFLEELDRRELCDIYVWSDDNLSTDHFWTVLSKEQREFLGSHPRYGKACCIKGFDAQSFAYNTLAAPALFDRQFDLLSKLQEETSIDYFVYLTITSPSTEGLVERMETLLDRLQQVHEFLPLRCVPLKIEAWGPVVPRMNPSRANAMKNQYAAVEVWSDSLSRRFPGEHPRIVDVPR